MANVLGWVVPAILSNGGSWWSGGYERPDGVIANGLHFRPDGDSHQPPALCTDRCAVSPLWEAMTLLTLVPEERCPVGELPFTHLPPRCLGEDLPNPQVNKLNLCNRTPLHCSAMAAYICLGSKNETFNCFDLLALGSWRAQHQLTLKITAELILPCHPVCKK